jgi:hypothetical protein
VDKIEQWIRQKLVSAVSAGSGQWISPSGSAIVRPIYRVTEGGTTLELSQIGIIYDAGSTHFECRYDEIESIIPVPLAEILKLRGDMSKEVAMGVILRGNPVRIDLRLPLRVYSNISTVIARIVSKFV